MRILFITTSFPPFMDMQSLRNIEIINYLATKGDNITIVYPFASWLKYEDNHLLELQNVEKVPTLAPPLILFQHYLSKKSYLKFFLRIYNVIINYIAYPDLFMGWARIAKRVVRELLLRQEYDVILTSSGSYTAHFIGSWTAKNHNLCWIADYGDPWSLDKYGAEKWKICLK